MHNDAPHVGQGITMGAAAFGAATVGPPPAPR